MSANISKLGPGTFKLGGTPGTDFSCQVQSMGVNPDADKGDPITPLCGGSIPGGITFTYVLAGTILQDLGAVDGLVKYTWTHKGETVAFEFVPSTADATSVAGQVVIMPLSIGASDGAFGDVLTSDFEFDCVGEPVPTWPAGP